MKNAPTCVKRLGTTTAGSSNFDCNRDARCWNPLRWHDLGLVALPTALYLRRYLVSFVRGTCVLRLCCRFHRQESGLRRCDLYKIVVARDFYVTKLRKESALPGVFVDFSRRAPSAALRLLTGLLAHELHRRAESNFRFVPVAQTQCPSTSRRPSLKSPCRLQSCPAQELSST